MDACYLTKNSDHIVLLDLERLLSEMFESWEFFWLTTLGRVVRKPVNVSPGLNIN